MCWFFIVIKLLVLKILLARLMGLSTALRYDYGYHPSAEEFDNSLHETRRTWTHNFLKTERDRELLKQQQQQQSKMEARYFVPKFNYESEQIKFNKFIQNPYKNPYNKPHDLQSASSNKNELALQNIGSSLEFTYEIPKPFYSNEIKPQFIRKPTTTKSPKTNVKPVTSSALPEINLKPIAKPDILTTNQKYSVNNLYKNNTQAQFPIYFTNPATGIVYAITEMGKSEQNLTRTNGSIPIFITKEQYEKDIFLLRNEYENNCRKDHKKYPITSFSRPTTTTTATTATTPQIIRIQKPSSPSLTASKDSAPNPLKKPPPVVVTTELIVKDKKPIGRPIRKKKKTTKSKKKIKKSKPPGRKPTGTTIRPILDQQPQGPEIIIGSRLTTRKPYMSTEKLSTQLEKPNYETTIFSSGPPLQYTDSNAAPLNPNLYFNNRRIHKRSVNTRTKTTKLSKVTNLNKENLLKNLTTLKTKQLLQNLNDGILTKSLLQNINNSKTNKKSNNSKLKFFLQNFNNSKTVNFLKNRKNFFKTKDFKSTKLNRNKYLVNSNNSKNDNLSKISTTDLKVRFTNLTAENLLNISKLNNPIAIKTDNLQKLSTNENLHSKTSSSLDFATENFLKSKMDSKYKTSVDNLNTKIDNFLKLPINPKLKSTNKNNSFKANLKKNPLNNSKSNKKSVGNMFLENSKMHYLLKPASDHSLKSTNLNYRLLPVINYLTEIPLKSKTDRIHKRSVDNITIPKFKKKTTLNKENVVKNSKKFTSENLFQNSANITGENLNNSSTNRSLRLRKNSTKNTNLTSGLTKNSRNFKNKFLTQTNSNHKLAKETNVKSPGNVKSHGNKKIFRNSKNRTKILRKKKRLNKNQQQISALQLNLKIPNNSSTSSSDINITTPRTITKELKKLSYKIAFDKRQKNSKDQDAEYDFFDFVGDDEESEEYDDEDDDEKDSYEDEDEEEAYNYENQEYDHPSTYTYTSEAGLSVEDLKEKITHENSSSAEEDADFGALEEEKFEYKNPSLDYGEETNDRMKTKATDSKKRIRRRPAQLKSEYDYEDDDDDENSISSNLGGFFRMIFYPVQVVMGSVMDTFLSKDSQEEKPIIPYTQYTSYHNTLKKHSSDEYYDDDDDYDTSDASSSSLSSWLSSWFGLNRRNKKIGSTTVAPVASKPTKSSTWLPSWLGFGANDRISTDTASTEDYDEYDKWFASWFGETKPKARKRTTTTTSTTTQLPQVPILTIVDPMRNPQNWIGILAHHIINHTSSTQNPLKDMWAKATSTTTENPEIPRKITYDKYQIWRLKPQDDTQVRALEEYKKSEDGIKLQWLKGPSLRGLTDVLVPPKMLVDFQASLTFELIDHEVLIFDVGKAIAYEKTKEDYFFTTTQNPKKHKGKHPTPPTMTWHKYYEYDDIIKYLETMRMRFPHLVELIHIGRSYEGRPLIVMKIESREAAAVNAANYPAHQKTKLRHKKRIGLANAVFIEAGTHGMEWIGPATATWIINELLKIMKKNSTDDQSFIRNTTWYIMPVLNPDGYVYSHEYDRFWKKSRSRHVSRPSGIINSAMTWLQKKRTKEKVCFGVDLDRNWHYRWGRHGSSKSQCNEFFAGPVPFSEPETKALSEFLMDYKAQIKLFISMQAYGQIISYPYKANTTYDSERLDDLLDVAMVGTDGLRKKGSKARYKIDSSNDLVENRSGCSDAFAAYEVGIPFSYTLQLADNGVHGYLLPSVSIESTAKDSFEIITGMLDYI